MCGVRQRDLTSLDTLWLPPTRPSLARFINSIIHGEESDIDPNGQDTLHTVEHGSTIDVLSSFLFGREDLIPDMFQRILPQWAESQQARGFAYYVERHIEMDGDDHGPAGLRALAEMAGSDAETWQAAATAARSAITARIALWEDVHAEILKV